VWPYDPVKACRFLDRSDTCERSYGVSVGSWQSEPTLVAERDRAARAGVAWASQARVLKNRPVEQIVAALASGRAVFAQIDIDSVAWGWRGVKGGVLKDYARADRGGHAVAIVGYRTLGPTPAQGPAQNLSSLQFLLHNSWGTDWGDHGYAWISEGSLRSHLIDAEVVDASPSSNAPPPPPAAPSACAPGSALDLGTGRCAAKCPSGLSPLLGACWLG